MKVEPMINLLPYLTNAKYTLCFNWIDNTATTSRYHEALACGIIPMAWKDTYDVTGILVKDEWQRVLTLEDFYDKIGTIDYEEKYNEIHETYKKNLMTKEEIYESYENILMRTING
jgi:hypothetical protein